LKRLTGESGRRCEDVHRQPIVTAMMIVTAFQIASAALPPAIAGRAWFSRTLDITHAARSVRGSVSNVGAGVFIPEVFIQGRLFSVLPQVAQARFSTAT
jgi:hypothetical protein